MKALKILQSKKGRAITFGVALFFVSGFSGWGPGPFVAYVLSIFAYFGFRKIRNHWAYMDTPEYKEKCRAEKIAELKEAIELKEWIKISYDGGTQPGAVRKIFPLRVSEDGKHLYGTNDKSDTEGVMFRIDLVTVWPMSTDVDYKEFKESA